MVAGAAMLVLALLSVDMVVGRRRQGSGSGVYVAGCSIFVMIDQNG